MWFASYLFEKGIITGDQFAKAVREQFSRRPLLGRVAIHRGMLTLRQCRKILSAQADTMEKPFGQLAVELGFVTREELADLILEQAESTPSLGEILVETTVLSRSQMLDELRQARQEAGYYEGMNKAMQASH
jgi:hypothetical protein